LGRGWQSDRAAATLGDTNAAGPSLGRNLLAGAYIRQCRQESFGLVGVRRQGHHIGPAAGDLHTVDRPTKKGQPCSCFTNVLTKLLQMTRNVASSQGESGCLVYEHKGCIPVGLHTAAVAHRVAAVVGAAHRPVRSSVHSLVADREIAVGMVSGLGKVIASVADTV